jgi:hypothetical protein
MQTKGQRNGAAVRRSRLSVRRKFVFSKASGTKGLELANGFAWVEKTERGSVPKSLGAFRIERSC